MEVVWHHNEFMQQVFLLVSIMEKNIQKKLLHSIRLQKLSLLKS